VRLVTASALGVTILAKIGTEIEGLTWSALSWGHCCHRAWASGWPAWTSGGRNSMTSSVMADGEHAVAEDLQPRLITPPEPTGLAADTSRLLPDIRRLPRQGLETR
jgi:hypothetical protein